MNPGLIILAGAGIAFYAHLAGLAYRSTLLRTKAMFPDLPIGTEDRRFLIFMAVWWPVTWPTSYLAYPSLRRLTRRTAKRSEVRAARTDAWATAELIKRVDR